MNKIHMSALNFKLVSIRPRFTSDSSEHHCLFKYIQHLILHTLFSVAGYIRRNRKKHGCGTMSLCFSLFCVLWHAVSLLCIQ